MRKLDWIAFAATAGMVALLLVTACRPKAEEISAATSSEDTLTDWEAELREREASVAQREAEVAQREAGGAPPEVVPIERIPLASAPLPVPPVERPAARPAPEPAPAVVYEPSPAPEPEPTTTTEPEPASPIVVTVHVPAGTTFEVEFVDALSSETSQIGETFEARAVADLMVGSGVAVPAGSTIHGRVTDARAGRRIGGRALLALAFDELRLPDGETFPLAATFAAEGRSDRKRDAATIGGSAAGGAVLGHVLEDSDKGTAIGAILGAAIGAGIAARTPGQPVEIPAGTVVALTLSEQLTVRRQMSG